MNALRDESRDRGRIRDLAGQRVSHGLRERVSLVEGDASGGVLAVNLYRGMAQPSFRDDEVDLLCRLAPPLLATVKLHLRLTAAQQVGELEPVVIGVKVQIRACGHEQRASRNCAQRSR